MEPTFWEILATAFLWSGVAALGLFVLAVVVGMIVVARKKDGLPQDEQDGTVLSLGAGVGQDGKLDEKITGAQLEMMAVNLRLRSERRRKTARNIRAVVIAILALWILGPMIYAFVVYVR